MFARGMVQDQIEDDPHAAPVDFFDQLLHILQGAVLGCNVCVAGNIVAEVRLRGDKGGRYPDGFNSQGLKIVELLKDALDVADSIPIAVVE